jgi:D-alanine--poly(phosphoribitol) ligase subunit 2
MTAENLIVSMLNKIINPQGKSIAGNTEKIFETGLIDSFGIVELVSALEEQFKIKIPFEELTIQNFASVNDIARLVERLKRQGA